MRGSSSQHPGRCFSSLRPGAWGRGSICWSRRRGSSSGGWSGRWRRSGRRFCSCTSSGCGTSPSATPSPRPRRFRRSSSGSCSSGTGSGRSRHGGDPREPRRARHALGDAGIGGGALNGRRRSGSPAGRPSRSRGSVTARRRWRSPTRAGSCIRPAFTLAYVTLVQSLILTGSAVAPCRGAGSARCCGSGGSRRWSGRRGCSPRSGWFTAFTLVTVAQVKAVGQVELVFSWLTARFAFGERPSRAGDFGDRPRRRGDPAGDPGQAAPRDAAGSRHRPRGRRASRAPRRRGERGDLGMVEGRRHLDHIHADEVEPAEPADQLQRLPAREPARHRGAGSRREGRIEPVDVEGEIDRRVPCPRRGPSRAPRRCRCGAARARSGSRAPRRCRGRCGCRSGSSGPDRPAPRGSPGPSSCRGRSGRDRPARGRRGRRPG